MTRITKLTVDQLDPELRKWSRADDKTPLELGLTRIFGHCPEMTKGMSAFAASLKMNRCASHSTTSAAAAWPFATPMRWPTG
jgi:hypothetical protein